VGSLGSEELSVQCLPSHTSKEQVPSSEDHCGSRALRPWVPECYTLWCYLWATCLCCQVGLKAQYQILWNIWFPSLYPPTGWWTTGRGLKPLRTAGREPESLSSPRPEQNSVLYLLPQLVDAFGDISRLGYLLLQGYNLGDCKAPCSQQKFLVHKEGKLFAESNTEMDTWSRTRADLSLYTVPTWALGMADTLPSSSLSEWCWGSDWCLGHMGKCLAPELQSSGKKLYLNLPSQSCLNIENTSPETLQVINQGIGLRCINTKA
jgi:hypothetical protein